MSAHGIAKGLGKLLLGGALIYEGYKSFVTRGADTGVLGLGRPPPQGRQPTIAEDGFKKATVHRIPAGNIDARLRYIQDRIKKDSLDPRIRAGALEILGRKCGPKGNQHWCVPEKDNKAEVLALFKAVKDPNSQFGVRYVRDHLLADQFTRAALIAHFSSGDCDDYAILLGSLLLSVGYPVKLRVIQAQGARSWSHIYLLVGMPPNRPRSWVPLDASVNKPAGWQAPGADECKATGRPAGVVVRVKDFNAY